MSMLQAVSSCLFAPMWGIMADRQVASKRVLLVTGCIIQGLVTAMLARVDSLAPLLVLRIINGAALASLGPISKSILAESVEAGRRGRIFSWLGAAVDFGRLLGAFTCTQLASRQVLGMQGWRVAFFLMGSLAVFAGSCAYLGVQDRGERLAPPSSSSKLSDEWVRLRSYLKIPSFVIIVLQGCFGAMPWHAFGYNTLFFQTAGLSVDQAATLVATFQICCMLGNLLGGVVGDALEARCPGHGRAYTAQISVFSGIPLVLLLYLLPGSVEGYFLREMLLVIMLGFCSTWCGAGVNAPILCEIVDVTNCTSIMAWETALEGSFASFFGNLSVGLLGGLVFGYQLPAEGSHQLNVTNTNKVALGKALALSTVLPWIVCGIAYCSLHWFYPEDKRSSAALGPVTTYGVIQEDGDEKPRSPKKTSTDWK